ncbi:MAG: serine hydrolase [Gemmatimonadaceae bacterium]
MAAALLLFVGALPHVGVAQQSVTRRAFPPDSVILSIIKQRVEEKRSAGIVVGLVDISSGGRRVVAYGDPGPGQPPLDANSIFEIGSISKVFTSTVLAQMVLEHKVSLDDPVQKYLPASVHVPSRNGKEITLGSLSVQNSGLPRLPGNLRPKDASNPYADYTVQQLYDFLSGYQLTRDPGERFEYSNLGVGLLGHALSLAAGKPYEALVRERVFAPLGMEHSAITLSPWMQAHLARGHDAAGTVVSQWDLPTFAGAGAIRSNAEDMMKFVAANLRVDRRGGAMGMALAFAHQPRAATGAPNMDIGLNWMVQRVGADTIIWHNGGTGGYRTFAGFEPSTGLGVVILTNSGNQGADDIGMHLLNPEIPLAPKPQPPKQRTAITLPDETLERYVGVYELAPQFSIEVMRKGGTLFAQATGQPAFQLWPESETDFFLKDVDAQVTFVRDANGLVTGLVLHQGGGNAPGKKVR